MFTAADRDLVVERLLKLARADKAIAGAAVTGSLASGECDRWSDIDLAFGIIGPLAAAIETWTATLYRDFGALHHWDLPAGQVIYRVFLLPGWLEADIAFIPQAEFGPAGPAWRTIFGSTLPVSQPPPPDIRDLTGRAWHHALHARTCIERGRLWQAEYWVSGLRDLVLALTCARLGYPVSYAKGAHLLPAGLCEPLQAALVASLEPAELRRALAAAAAALAAELDRADPDVAPRVRPLLSELAGPRN
ncbi:MAG: hypothetical protein LBV34_21905 [Nocardiopsaceae bacterium]|jgi:hypothetical protein|nr:hypothetical protein [Nocardiopsaceae bacterium]